MYFNSWFKGVSTTTQNEGFFSFCDGGIDRNRIVCQPVEAEEVKGGEQVERLLKKLYIEFMLSVGRKHDKTLNDYIKDIYHYGE